jgi:lactocepin
MGDLLSDLEAGTNVKVVACDFGGNSSEATVEVGEVSNNKTVLIRVP